MTVRSSNGKNLVNCLSTRRTSRGHQALVESEKSEGASGNSRGRWDVLVNRQFIVAILLVVAVPVYAHAQKLRVGDAQKVVTIIGTDRIKTQSYCEIMKLGEQVGQAYEKNDRKMVDELSQKIDTLEKILGPEYVALINRVPEIAENDQLRAEFLSAFGKLARLCTR